MSQYLLSDNNINNKIYNRNLPIKPKIKLVRTYDIFCHKLIRDQNDKSLISLNYYKNKQKTISFKHKIIKVKNFFSFDSLKMIQCQKTLLILNLYQMN